MKRSFQLFIKANVYILIFTMASISAQAQKKLNSVQEGSVLAPARVKIDAKLNEWPETFQAYNKATSLFYTMANDNDNLYLVMKSTDQGNSSKIIAGGIKFTINTSNNKKDKDKGAFVIKYPIIDMANLQGMIMQRMRPQNGGAPQPMDSAAIANIRKQMISSIKEIGLSGFKDIPDSLISIYNEYNIKAAIDVDAQNNLTIEMAIPLKYLQTSGPITAFNYNIQLNGLQFNFPRGGGGMPQPGGFQGGGGGFQGGGGGFQGGGFQGGGGGGMPRGMDNIAALLSPTYFSARYTLAVK